MKTIAQFAPRAAGLLTSLAVIGGIALAPACSKRASETPPTTAEPATVKPAEADADEATAKAPEGEANPTDPAADPTPTPTDAPTDAPTADGPCGEYSQRLCKEAGEATETCNAVKTVVNDLLPAAACEAGLKDIQYTVTKLADMRKGCDDLVAKLCKDLGEDTETCAMVKRETPKFPPERCTQFLKQYDQVLADLQRMEAKNKPLDADKIAKLTADGAASFGPKDAKVTVIEFSDFQCPYCSRAANVVEQVKEKYSDKVHFVFRHFPLSFHKDAHLASQAAMAANAQGKFFEMHDKMFENQRALSREDLEKYATELGLDMEKFKAALDNGTYKEVVDADIALGTEVAVDGTPTLFINGKRASNPTDFAAVSAMIEEEMK